MMRKEDVVTENDIEKYYLECRKIKFRYIDKPTSPKNLMENVIKHKCATTYTRGGHQCYGGRVRSLDDLIKLYKYYYPTVKVSKIIKNIQAFSIKVKQNEGVYINFSYCPNIKKYNFQNSYTSYGFSQFINTTSDFRDQGFKNCDVEITSYFK